MADPNGFHEQLANIRAVAYKKAKKIFDEHYETNCSPDEESSNELQNEVIASALSVAHDFLNCLANIVRRFESASPGNQYVLETKRLVETEYHNKLNIYARIFPTLRAREAAKRMAEKQSAPREMNDEVKDAIASMNELAELHTMAFPPLMPAGTLAIPTGRLLKCICKPGCQVDLPEPEYRQIDKSELETRWLINEVSEKKKGK